MRYYRPYMKILIWVIIGTFAMAGLDLIFPIVVRNLINQVLPAKDMQRLFIGSAVLLVLYIINFIIQFMVQYYGHVMSASIEHDMRRDLFSHIEKLSFHYFDNEKRGSSFPVLPAILRKSVNFPSGGPMMCSSAASLWRVPWWSCSL